MPSAQPAPVIDFDAIPEALRKEMNITREAFEEIQHNMREREAGTPAVGSLAPDFELRRLGADGSPTNERLRLSSLRGRPVALVFGSYT